jgi:hypothetical protein
MGPQSHVWSGHEFKASFKQVFGFLKREYTQNNNKCDDDTAIPMSYLLLT